MKNLFGLLLVSGALVLSSCNKDHYLTETEKENFDEMVNPTISNVVFVQNNDIYYMISSNYPAINITEDQSIERREPRISPDGRRIAFLDKSSHPVIIDRFTGDEIKRYDTLVAGKNYDWNPAPSGQSSNGLWMLVGDKIKFTETPLDNPSLIFAGNLWHSACFDVSGNFYFLITEDTDPDKIVKLYRWEKETQKIKRMTLEKPITNPANTVVQAAQNGDILLKTSFGGAATYDTYYVYPAGQLKHTIRVQQPGMLDVRYNGNLKQGLIFGPNPVKLNVEMTIKNHTGYARSVDRSIDTAFVKPTVKYFEWK